MIVLLHGVPETAAIWEPLRAELTVESTALALPGFGCPRPDGFSATKDEYLAWLAAELASFPEPVHLVGHDWGAALTYGIATRHGELLASWITDGLSGVHPDYVWHDFAQTWLTPGEGEAFWDRLLTSELANRAAIFELSGVGHDDAVALAGAQDTVMAGCILDLYRSANPNIAATWGVEAERAYAPGLILPCGDDPFDTLEMTEVMADMVGAGVHPVAGLGHWWMLQAPAEMARTIEAFVRSVDDRAG